jgi:hypothetical protein
VFAVVDKRKRAMMSELETFLEEALKQQYQPYYACYWFCFNRPMGEFGESNADFIGWIGARHREFSPTANFQHGEKYHQEFFEFLKKYVVENRITECGGQ